MNYTIYNSTTGQIVSVISTNDKDSLAAMLDGQSYIPGDLRGQNVYVDQGNLIPMPADPSTELTKYTFDWTNKTWVLDQEQTTANTRLQRNVLLLDIDKINAIRFAMLSDEQKQQLIAYRQALLDVPQQQQFPICTLQ
jgi:hypothetical protein